MKIPDTGVEAEVLDHRDWEGLHSKFWGALWPYHSSPRPAQHCIRGLPSGYTFSSGKRAPRVEIQLPRHCRMLPRHCRMLPRHCRMLPRHCRMLLRRLTLLSFAGTTAAVWGVWGGAERQGEGMNRQYKKWYSKSDKKRSIYWVEKDCIFSHS